VQGWLWLRWIFCLAWTDAVRTVARLGPDAAGFWGIGQSRQLLRVLRLALGSCIPPIDCYRFGLVRHPERALDYVYEHELPAYHHWRSAPPGPSAASLALLQDKLALAAELAGLQVPVVETLQCVPKTEPLDSLLERLQGPGRVFCKSRSGHAGIGAFSAWRTPAGLAGRCLDGRMLPDTDAVNDAWQHLHALGDTLIQPCLTNHRALQPLTDDDAAIGVRYISQWRGTEATCLCALLEIPSGVAPGSDRTRYCILPIDPRVGRVLEWPRDAYLFSRDRQSSAKIRLRVPDDFSLPDWSALVAASHRAHARFPDLWAIAWDWILTPTGPFLLEGNSGWGTTIPQIIHGAFLAAA
jgi:hypothetical protein